MGQRYKYAIVEGREHHYNIQGGRHFAQKSKNSLLMRCNLIPLNPSFAQHVYDNNIA